MLLGGKFTWVVSVWADSPSSNFPLLSPWHSFNIFLCNIQFNVFRYRLPILSEVIGKMWSAMVTQNRLKNKRHNRIKMVHRLHLQRMPIHTKTWATNSSKAVITKRQSSTTPKLSRSKRTQCSTATERCAIWNWNSKSLWQFLTHITGGW